MSPTDRGRKSETARERQREADTQNYRIERMRSSGRQTEK